MIRKKWKLLKQGTVTTPRGFLAMGLHAGIKKNNKKLDSSLVFSKTSCVAAGTFTTNKVKAWPVLHSMSVMKGPNHRAIVVSSGNANCVNGEKGKVAVEEIIATTANSLKIKKEEILIAQTGLIGVPFPITCFKRVVPQLVKGLSSKGGHLAAQGIMTTDIRTKEVAVSFMLHGKKVTIGAMSKGAGMVHPGMATMLCFLTTDVKISKPLLARALRHAVDDTFNKISIDNDMSTNDTVFVLANGQSGAPAILKVDQDYRLFREALEEVCRIMAHRMIQDGEGVSHVCCLKVSGAKNPTEAERASRHIANSMLFKTMLAGADPNWGRIVAAIGASGVSFDMKHLSVTIGDVNIVKQGRLKVLGLPKARRVLQKKEYDIQVVIGKGRGRSEFITCDLTTKYVQINASYS